MEVIKQQARQQNVPIRLGALRGSRSNHFYTSQGFSLMHEEQWDIHYVWQPSSEQA